MDNRDSNLKQNPFKVPEGYFEEQELHLMKAFKASSTKTSTRSIKLLRRVAASLLILVVAGIAFMTYNNSNELLESSLTDEERLQYLLEEDAIEELIFDNEFEISALDFVDIENEYLEAYLDGEFERNDLLIIEN